MQKLLEAIDYPTTQGMSPPLFSNAVQSKNRGGRRGRGGDFGGGNGEGGNRTPHITSTPRALIHLSYPRGSIWLYICKLLHLDLRSPTWPKKKVKVGHLRKIFLKKNEKYLRWPSLLYIVSSTYKNDFDQKKKHL